MLWLSERDESNHEMMRQAKGEDIIRLQGRALESDDIIRRLEQAFKS
jgi:hypothetical protein